MKESKPIELEDMSQERARVLSAQEVKGDERKMRLYDNGGTSSTWSYATATWILFMAIPFLAFPRFLLFLSGSATGVGYRENLTPLENFLSTHFAIFALSIAVALIISIPQGMYAVPQQYKQESCNPLILPLSSGFLLSSFLSYNTPSSEVGPLAMFMCIGTGLTGLWGLFLILFAGSSSISRKTGADKRTSRFLFWNSSAASAQKNRLKRNG